jgi:tripartite-type tricarboxylate transporter receptor subunit TctC
MTEMKRHARRLQPVLFAAALFGAAPAVAQTPESLAGKNVTLIIGFGPGGG